MPYDVFWRLNPRKLEPFQTAAEMDQKAMQNRVNFTAWVNGLYVTHAVAACFSKNSKYPSKPIDLFGTAGKATPQQEAQMFENFMHQHNAQKQVAEVQKEQALKA